MKFSWIRKWRAPWVAIVLLAAAIAHSANDRATAFLADAQTRFGQKDYAGAIIQLKNVLQIEPKTVAALVLLGKSLLRVGDASGAEITLNEALLRGAERAEVLPTLAQSLIAQGKQRQLFEQAQFAAPDLPATTRSQLLLLRAGASSDVGELREAMKFIDAARQLDPHSPESWLAEVPVRIRLRQFKEANDAIGRATAMAPNAAETLFQKGSVLHLAGNTVGALAAYDNAIKVDSDHQGALMARVGIYIDQKRNADAAKDLAELTRLNPNEPRAAYLRALLAERENKPEVARLALIEITEQLDRIPMDYIRFRPQVLMLNGLAHFGLNEPEKAKVYFEAFQKVQPESPTAKMLAQIYLRAFDYDRAVDVLEKYLKAQPQDGQAMALLGSALMAKGQTARAASLMQQALQTRESPELRKVLGLSLMQRGETGNAIKELETAFKNDPRQIQAAAALIPLYFRSGQAPKALALAEKLVKSEPNNPGFHNLLGIVRVNSGSPTTAKAAFEQALKLSPNFTSPKLNLARLEIAGKSYDTATTRLNEILKREPKNTEVLYELATIAERQGKPAEVINWLGKANKLAGPREVRWGLALSDHYLRQGNARAALDAAKEMSAKDPEGLSVLLALARAQLASGDITNARSTLTLATRVGDYDPRVQVQIAVMQVAAKNPSGANYSLEKALSSQPDYLPALALMTDLDLAAGDKDKAEKRARDILAKYPKRAIGHSLVGDVAQAKGQTVAAIEAYRRAHGQEPSTDTFVRLYRASASQDGGKPAAALASQWLKSRPKDAQAHKEVAETLAGIGKFAESRIAYESLVKLVPDDSHALNGLANVLLRLKDPDAIKVAEQAVAKDPSNAYAIDTLGWALALAGQPEKALKHLKDAKFRDPANSEIRYHLAVVLAQTGLKKEARDELDIALKSGIAFEGSADASALRKSLN